MLGVKRAPFLLYLTLDFLSLLQGTSVVLRLSSSEDNIENITSLKEKVLT